MGIAAARLNRRVRIEQKGRVSNGQGGWTTGWAAAGTVWAEIIGLSGDEALQQGVQRNVQQWRVTVRRRAVSAGQRLFYLGSAPGIAAGPYDIKSVLPDSKAADAIVLVCETGLSQG
jgi:SPP1 family predicted phage head-tail adaptor